VFIGIIFLFSIGKSVSTERKSTSFSSNQRDSQNIFLFHTVALKNSIFFQYLKSASLAIVLTVAGLNSIFVISHSSFLSIFQIQTSSL